MTVTAAPRPTGPPGYDEQLPCTPQSVGDVRELVATVLTAWHLAPEAIEDCVLVASELASNVVRHTRCVSYRIQLVRLRSDVVRISVEDGAAALPTRCKPDEQALHGRGLQLVEALSLVWGTAPLPRGKRVWAVVMYP